MTTVSLAGLTLSVAAVTDPGLRRPANEDSMLAVGPAFVVADGMGGYECGDLASAAVVSAFADRLQGAEYGSFADVHAALLDADDRVEVVARSTRTGAGSTATGAVLIEHAGRPHWLVFNVGDSRVYRHLGSDLEQLTHDHSLGRELVESGQLRAEDLATYPDRNVITRAIGAADSLADSWLVPVVTGERLLLCSDGLHGELADEDIRAVLTMSGHPESAARVLVERAKEHGGRDNITVIVIDVVAGGASVLADGTTEAHEVVIHEFDDDTLTVSQ
ncbi:PP2C family serine/threonine-protein phosphatase [Demequina sp. NBRC 110053]|uniref:PP2C family protein-serine/threonine phosphatase n=1 Tax=Demequina sp. NBRC 110053 TaxID=1570342 RepID=UPI001184F19E|nr:protein phosphatase 2C domain-containing protein [Demequina sp. NBRC 110053]